MAAFSRELFLQTLTEWGRYHDTFAAVPPQEQAAFLEDQGFASVRDLLTHVAAWWEEARKIIADTLKNGDQGPRQYDLDAFNAASLQRYKTLSDAQFAAWYELERQLMLAVVSGLTVEQLGIRRIANWLNAVLLEHLKEHGWDAPRFLVQDILQREWAEYVSGYSALNAGQQVEFLQKQGFVRFRDVLAHIMAWWEQGVAVIRAGSVGDPSDVDDVDAFNALAVRQSGNLEDQLLLARFDEARLTLVSLVDMLPDEIITRPNIRDWLRADVLDHYYEHAL